MSKPQPRYHDNPRILARDRLGMFTVDTSLVELPDEGIEVWETAISWRNDRGGKTWIDSMPRHEDEEDALRCHCMAVAVLSTWERLLS